MRKVMRQILARPEMLILPGIADAFGAKIVQEAGFEAVYVGSWCINSTMGLPDTGLSTVTEMAERAGAVARAVGIPVISDIDSGYGSAINVMRAIREFERAGVAGVHLEDQALPKRCGQLPGGRVISKAEALGKLHAALDARVDPDFIIIARTDALIALDSMEAAIERSLAYAEAGADVSMVIMHRGPELVNQVNTLTSALTRPLMIDVQEFGPRPSVNLADLATTRLKIALVPTTLGFYTPLTAIRRDARIIKEFGLAGVERLFNENDSNDSGLAFIGMAEMNALTDRYSEKACSED